MRVIEIGCGTGNLSIFIKRLHPQAEVVGLDPDPKAAPRDPRDQDQKGVRYDDDLGTRWASAWSDPQWLALDLGSPRRVGRVSLVWEDAYARGYDVQVSSDGSSWRTVASVAITPTLPLETAAALRAPGIDCSNVDAAQTCTLQAAALPALPGYANATGAYAAMERKLAAHRGLKPSKSAS